MGWLEAEKREGTIQSGSGGVTVSQLFGAAPNTSAGVPVNENKAKKYSAFFNGVTYSMEKIGALPLKLYERLDGGGRAEVTSHPASGVVKEQPNPEMSAIDLRATLQAHLLMHGNAYAEIVPNGRGQTKELWPLNPKKTKLKRDNQGNPFYETKVNGTTETLAFHRVLHIRGPGGDGLHGWSILKLARESIGLGLAAEEYSSRFFSNNATPSGILTTPTELKPEQKEKLKAQWEAAHGGLSKQHRVALLEGDLDWQSLGISAEDAQLLESRRFTIHDMSRFFRLPPHKLMENSNATLTNIESQNREVKEDHLQPWARRWELALDTSLLSERERGQRELFFKFNMSAFLRPNAEARTEKQRTEVTHGLASINEIRTLEERNPFDTPLADEPLVRMDVMPLSMADQMDPTQRALVKAVSDGNPETIEKLAEVRLKELDRDTETREETRSPQGRRELVNTWRPIFRRDFERLVRIESQDIRSEAGLLAEGGVDAFIEFLDAFYSDDIVGLVDRSLTDVFRQYARAVTREAASEVEDDPLSDDALRGFMGDPQDAQDDGDAETYLGGFTRRYAATSRVKLSKAVERAQDREDDDPRDALDRELERWNEGDEDTRSRPERKSDWEANQVNNAVAKATFAAAGVSTLRWRAWGKNCPLCNSLDGTIVSIQSSFVGEGDELEGTDGETTITPRTSIGHPPLHAGCWTPDHDIFTASGWRPITEVEQGDRLWTMDPETRHMELDRVQGAWTKRWTDKVASIQTRTMDLRLTPDHKMAIVTDWNHKHGNDEPLERVEAQDLTYGAAIPRVPKWEAPNPDTIEIAGRAWPAQKAMAWFGWYLAEGTICEHGSEGIWQVGLRQYDDGERGKIDALCRELFDTVWTGQDTIYVPLRDGDPLVELLRDLGHSGDRYIPRELMQYGPETLRPMFDALVAGDGTVCEAGWSNDDPYKQGDFRPRLTFSTSSERLASDMTELAQKVGLRPTVGPRGSEPRTTTHHNGTYTAKKVQQQLSFGRYHWSTFRHGQLEYEDYEGAVVGVSMENNPVVLVRRNRKTCWVGNCDCNIVPS